MMPEKTMVKTAVVSLAAATAGSRTLCAASFRVRLGTAQLIG
jgi:hypothetical protein